MKGGIVRYGETYGDKGLWEGSLYVFDNRMHMDFSADTKTIGQCDKCNEPTKQFYDCSNLACRDLILLCENCAKVESNRSCSKNHTRGKANTLG